MRVIGSQCGVVIFLTLATHWWGGLGLLAAVCGVCSVTRTLWQRWLRAVQYSTLGATALVLLPTLDGAPLYPDWQVGWCQAGLYALGAVGGILLLAALTSKPGQLALRVEDQSPARLSALEGRHFASPRQRPW